MRAIRYGFSRGAKSAPWSSVSFGSVRVVDCIHLVEGNLVSNARHRRAVYESTSRIARTAAHQKTAGWQTDMCIAQVTH
jgi:hypothetical protein